MYIAFSLYIFVQSEYAFFDIFIGYSKRGHFGLHAKKNLSQKCSQFREENGLVARFLYRSLRLAGCGNALR